MTRRALIVLTLLALAAPAVRPSVGRAGEAEPAPAPRPAPTAGDPAEGKTVLEIKVEGLTTLDPSAVTGVMNTRKGEPFRRSTYRADYDRIFRLGYFDAHDVVLHEPEIAAEGVRLRITCRERPLIHKVVVRGNRVLKRHHLIGRAREEKTLLKAGERFDLYAAHRMARSMKSYYLERRYSMAVITPKAEPVPDRPGQVYAVFEVREDSRVYVNRVVFNGRKSLPEKKLLRSIESRPGGFLRVGAKFSADVARLDAVRLESVYHNSGYSDARVKLLPPSISGPLGRRQRRMATLTFDILEGQQYVYGQLSFTGLESVSEEEVRKRLRLTPGKPYSNDAVMAAIRTIRAMLGETGRPFPRVAARRARGEKPHVVGLAFTIKEGPQASVGEIRIKGNTRTRDKIIRREMELLPGDIYDSRKLSRSRSNLRRRGIFARVSTHEVPGDEPDTVDLEVEVEETRTGHIQIGASVSPEDGAVGGGFSITENNFDLRRWPRGWEEFSGGGAFRGAAQRLRLSANISESTKRADLSFTDPWLWDTPAHYSFSTSFFYTDKDYDDYEDRRAGMSVRLGRRLFIKRFFAHLQYTLQEVYLDDLDPDLPADVLADEGTTLLSSLELGLSFDGRDNVFVPTRGVLVKASQSIFGGPMGGDEDFRKTSIQAHVYVPLVRTFGYAHVIHLYGRGDMANPFNMDTRIPVYERYYAGGVSTVRGYDYRSLSPRVDGEEVGGHFRMIQSAEYSFPLYQDVLRGVFYFDAGNVWTDEGDFEWHDQRRSVGAGLLIKTPPHMGNMPIKLYFSKAINPSDEDETETFQMSFSLLF
ncbi:MAG: outer membrane protein assembly factor BamA [Planctomycetota bacterium]|jgi:outer membrane protein insertion porin family